MSYSIEITVYGNRHETTFKFPAKYVVCPSCEGHGTDRGRNVECDGGGFTAAEWDEQDEEFRQDYMAGRYDLPCECCKGKRVIQVIDEDAIPTRGPKRWLHKVLAEHRRQDRDSREIDHIQEMERRMGA